MVVVAASPTTSPAPDAGTGTGTGTGRSHPTYTKMITRALTDLGGASPRPPIAAYILHRFSGLPASHDALLSAHLRRLVAEGVLRTHGAVSPSYRLFDQPPPVPVSVSVPVPVPVVGEKRGRGRPRKTPLQSPASLLLTRDSVTNTGQEADAVGGQEEARVFQTTPVQSGGASSVTVGIKRGRGRPRKHKPPPAMSYESKRGPGRPRKEKPSQPAAALSPTASRRFKRGCGRPSMGRPSAPSTGIKTVRPTKDKPAAAPTSAPQTGIKRRRGRPRKDNPAAAAMPARTGTAGVEQSGMQKLAAAALFAQTGGGAAGSTGTEAGGGPSRMAAAMSAKRGPGRPRKKKSNRGRPRRDHSTLSPTTQDWKDQSTPFPISHSIGAGLVEAACELLFEEAVTKVSQQDLVSGGKTQIDGVVMGDREKPKATDDGAKAQAANAVGPGGMKETSAAAIHAEYGDVASARAGTEPGVGTPRMEGSLPARSETGHAMSTGVKRPRGRPRKKIAATADGGAMLTAEAMSAEIGDAVSKIVKRGRGMPRKEKPAAPISAGTADTASAGVKRGRGRPRKAGSTGTWFAEAAADR